MDDPLEGPLIADLRVDSSTIPHHHGVPEEPRSSSPNPSGNNIGGATGVPLASNAASGAIPKSHSFGDGALGSSLRGDGDGAFGRWLRVMKQELNQCISEDNLHITVNVNELKVMYIESYR